MRQSPRLEEPLIVEYLSFSWNDNNFNGKQGVNKSRRSRKH